ncbi:hypothetical protein EXVG_00389 [Emiliania huxleyi virus 202]|nr:hypothetical protein EXVG_00389 [Emiliania huxleyi virus 202]AHA54348.1 hypothetical protein EhV18_00302 [Emiliania huxleyi virus 18]AHA55386.1 hypothetical protein EhV156_00291 [Emiliania huxleyi virus 156]
MNKVAIFGFVVIVIVIMISMLIWTFYPKKEVPSSIENAATLDMGDESEMQVDGGDPEDVGKNDEDISAGREIQPAAVPEDSLIQTNSITPPRIDPPISSRDHIDTDVPNPLFVNSNDLTNPTCKVHDGGVWAMCHNAPFKRWTQMHTTTEDTLAACAKHYAQVKCPPRV